MKKYSVLTVLAISLFAFSCGSDDSDEPAVKCLKCTGNDKICVGDAIDPTDSSKGTHTEETLQLFADLSNAFVPGACTFE